MNQKMHYTVPYASPAYGPPPYYMQEGRVILVTFDIDEATATEFVAPPLKWDAGTLVSAFIGDMLQIPYCGRFHEGGIVFSVTHCDVTAPYTPYLWTSTDEAMIVGREVYGMPKMLCDDDSQVEWSGNQVRGVVNRRGEEIMAINLNIEEKVDPAEVPRNDSRLSVRVIPDPSGGNKNRRQVLHFALDDFAVHDAWKGPATLRLPPHPQFRTHELMPDHAILTGYYLQVSWTLGLAQILAEEEG